MTKKTPQFLLDLLEARSPSGHEYEAQSVVDTYIKPISDGYSKDTMGNRFGVVNKKGDPVVMLAGHMDELGLMVKYIDKHGFIYFDTIGGHDLGIISGRRVTILAEKGPIEGVTGKRAVHLMTHEERMKAPKLHQLWIDIGAKDKKECEKYVSIGDSAVYDMGFQPLLNKRVTSRAFDDKAGCYVVMEALRRLAKQKAKLKAKVVSVATAQEEVGVRGATTSSYSVNPHISITVDVGHATDHPECDPKKFGEFKLGGGPIITRGPNNNPLVYKKLETCAKKLKIPYQIEGESRPAGNDARTIQMSRAGVATGIVSLPLRYMHTPSEIMDLDDIENAIKLLVAFCQSIKKGETCEW